MAFNPFVAAILAMAAQTAAADPVQQVHFTSHAPDKTYGIYLAAPATGCTIIRYRISGQGIHAQTVVLRAGEARLVRLGSGFARGAHAVRIDSVGCPHPPTEARRVVLRKASPDHGARALAYIKAHALGEGKS